MFADGTATLPVTVDAGPVFTVTGDVGADVPTGLVALTRKMYDALWLKPTS